MQRIIETITSALRTALNDLVNRITEFLPNLVSALLILFMGWILAKIAEFALKRLLQALRIDQAAEGRGVAGTMRDLGISRAPSSLISRTAFWVILILFLVPALETLKLVYVSQLLGQLVNFIPNLIAAVLIFLIGLAFARFLAGTVAASARKAGLEYASAIGMFVQYFLSLVIIILALAQVGVQTAILTNIFIVLIISLGLALSLSLGLGSRAVVANILAGAFAREHFHEGREVVVQGIHGKVVEVGSVNTVIDSEGRQITVPNTLLVENVIE